MTQTSCAYDVAAPPDVLTDGTLKYVYGLSLAYAADGAGNVQVHHADGLGSIRALTDGSGALIETYQTDPFGVPTQTQGTSTQPFQFAGQQADAESEFYRLRARILNVSAGFLNSVSPGRPANPSSLPASWSGDTSFGNLPRRRGAERPIRLQ